MPQPGRLYDVKDAVTATGRNQPVLVRATVVNMASLAVCSTDIVPKLYFEPELANRCRLPAETLRRFF
jgi:hypothetical protein